MSDVADLMKRCQRGVGGRNALNDAHDIMAECYGTLGQLEAERDTLRQQLAERDAEIMEQCRVNGMGAERELKLIAQRDKLAGLLREAEGELRTDRHHGLRPKIYAALSELTP